jgi:hypothetical protein
VPVVANPRRRRRPRVAISSSPVIEASAASASLSAVTSVASRSSIVSVTSIASITSITSITSIASVASVTSTLTAFTITHASELSVALALGFLSLHHLFAYPLVLELCEIDSQPQLSSSPHSHASVLRRLTLSRSNSAFLASSNSLGTP